MFFDMQPIIHIFSDFVNFAMNIYSLYPFCIRQQSFFVGFYTFTQYNISPHSRFQAKTAPATIFLGLQNKTKGKASRFASHIPAHHRSILFNEYTYLYTNIPPFCRFVYTPNFRCSLRPETCLISIGSASRDSDPADVPHEAVQDHSIRTKY